MYFYKSVKKYDPNHCTIWRGNTLQFLSSFTFARSRLSAEQQYLALHSVFFSFIFFHNKTTIWSLLFFNWTHPYPLFPLKNNNKKFVLFTEICSMTLPTFSPKRRTKTSHCLGIFLLCRGSWTIDMCADTNTWNDKTSRTADGNRTCARECHLTTADRATAYRPAAANAVRNFEYGAVNTNTTWQQHVETKLDQYFGTF